MGSKGISKSVGDGIGGDNVRFSNELSELLEIFEKTVEFAWVNDCLTIPRVNLLLASAEGLLET